MFKKTVAELKPPKPPTFAQILEDMETFLVEKPPIEKVRTLPTANLEENSKSSCSIDDWWKVFETFYSDNEDLQTVRRKITASQTLLGCSKKEITDKIDSIQCEIDKALQDPPISLSECGK